ncbi:rod-binding protein [Roseicyclus mahoneyensis]|uniref:Flagellar protein FlgJ n=1 Tax=Roseicyclus mahoneyensis TaxID=164332 RepID=A0A316GZ57_9RHOB|nr:rod-binding protein [Roseicyclus mahoneyensis]PWK60419.1 flagellar protein FlgJ [Roseicyclus mahoneyensis]
MDLPLIRPQMSFRPEAPVSATDPALLQAAQGFEAIILQQMLQTARAASLGDGLFEGTGSDTTNAMLDRALAESGAGRAGLGLAETIARQLAPLAARAGQGG